MGGFWILGFLLLVEGCSREETIPLRDERTVRVWDVTYGTNHIAPGQPVQMLDKRLTDALRRILRACYPAAAAPVQTISTKRPTLVMWTRPLAASTNSQRPILLRFLHPLQTSAVGIWVEAQGTSGMTGLPEAGSVTIDRFPRRAETIVLEVQEPVAGSREWPTTRTVLHLRNPKPYRGPGWNPDGLPITRTESGVRATLFDLTVTNWILTKDPAAGRIVQKTFLRFEASGPDGRPLRVLGYELSDPGGNQIVVPIGKAIDRNTPHAYQAALFPGDPALRLNVETDLPADDPAAAVERVEFSNLGDPDEVSGLGPRTTPFPPDQTSSKIPGLGITLFNFSFGQTPSVEVGVRGRPPGVRVELERVRDEFGRNWEAQKTGFNDAYAAPDYTTYRMSSTNTFTLKPKSLSLTFRIYRTAIFEFHPPAKFSTAMPMP